MDGKIDLIKKKGLIGCCKYLIHYLSEKYNEKKLGIKTSGFLCVKDLGIEQEGVRDYEPISYKAIFHALNFLEISPERDVFIDYGSGKGRAVIAAATKPFKKAMGIEISEDLNKVAIDNYNEARSRNMLACNDVEFITGDALKYTPSDDITVVLLYNPFSIELTKDVINKYYDSVTKVPRELSFIYRYPNWTEDPFMNDPRFKEVYRYDGYSDVGEILRIYRLNK